MQAELQTMLQTMPRPECQGMHTVWTSPLLLLQLLLLTLLILQLQETMFQLLPFAAVPTQDPSALAATLLMSRFPSVLGWSLMTAKQVLQRRMQTLSAPGQVAYPAHVCVSLVVLFFWQQPAWLTRGCAEPQSEDTDLGTAAHVHSWATMDGAGQQKSQRSRLPAQRS